MNPNVHLMEDDASSSSSLTSKMQRLETTETPVMSCNDLFCEESPVCGNGGSNSCSSGGLSRRESMSTPSSLKASRRVTFGGEQIILIAPRTLLPLSPSSLCTTPASPPPSPMFSDALLPAALATTPRSSTLFSPPHHLSRDGIAGRECFPASPYFEGSTSTPSCTQQEQPQQQHHRQQQQRWMKHSCSLVSALCTPLTALASLVHFEGPKGFTY